MTNADARRHRVVIVGGGFAGLTAARRFRHQPVSVTLVDRAGHHLFAPLLYQCATGILSFGDIAAPFRSLLKRHANVETLLAEATDVDVARHEVVAVRPGGDETRIGYDHLVVAAGVGQSYFGHEEFARHAPGMKTLTDALVIRQRVFGAFELAESAPTEAERRYWLTFVLVGGGPTGVELAGQIRELATHTLRREFRVAAPEHARILLFDGGSEPLASFGPELSRRAAAALTRLGVELHMRSRVTKVDERGVEVRGEDGTTRRYDAGTVLWTAGVEATGLAHALARATGASQDHAGRIRVAPDLTVPGHPDIFVVGDMMSLDGLPGVAEVAVQTGWYAATKIRHAVDGRPPPGPFRYHDVGQAAYISRGRAVVSTGRFHTSGLLGWSLWLVIHITWLTGYRNRVAAVLSWLVTFAVESRRERAFTSRELETSREVYSTLRQSRREHPAPRR